MSRALSPEAWQRRRRIGLVVLLGVLLALPLLPGVERFDLLLLDWQFQLKRQISPDQRDADVVLIGIDEQTYESFPEPFALWHPHLGEMFQALALVGPKVVGLDLALPDRSYNSLAPGYDQKLLQGLLAMRQVASVVLGITIDQNGNTRKVHSPFLSLVGNQGQAFVLWKLDPDRVVRRFTPMLGAAQRPLPTLVSRMAGHLGLEANAGLIDYSQGRALDYVPLQQMLDWYRQGEGDRLRRTFADKVVLLGSVLPFEDRHYQPVNLAAWEEHNNHFVPGVLIHAQALRNLLLDGFIQPLPQVLAHLLLLLLALLWWPAATPRAALLLGLAFTPGLLLVQYGLLGQGHFLPAGQLLLGLLLVLAGRQGVELWMQIAERSRLKELFKGYVSPQVLQEILSGRLEPGVSGKQQYACVMFSDIRNFTTLSEKMPPTQLVAFLNRYLGEMASAIQNHDGTVDKFIGDGIMAVFGAPQPTAVPARNAMAAAEEKLERLRRLNQAFAEEGLPQLKIGIGLHLGEVIVGNIGSAERNDYTAIGDVVNTASRLEGLTKQTGYPVVVSAAVYQALMPTEGFDDLGEIPVKGRSPVAIYGWPAVPGGPPSPVVI
ncbi:adenylate/guanylate cyclase domain-containing protein [Magnetovirga frankeli]|uniref:adenylate/guanylate cyclase domain-containing protein n=1 Tax=Magnetovirga frankeli TaxID=947516 RepID=UPI001AF130F0|nr:adenylate/guanylate cyclase domain-containing protein [gamma proteobacterium SS-5]